MSGHYPQDASLSDLQVVWGGIDKDGITGMRSLSKV
jgi:hypothetical protein